MVKTLLIALFFMAVSSQIRAEDWRPVSSAGQLVDIDSVYASKTDGMVTAKFKTPGEFPVLLIFDCRGHMMVPGMEIRWMTIEGGVWGRDEFLLCAGLK